MTTPTLDEITSRLERDMAPSRFRHTLGVLHAAAELASRHGIDLRQASLAALLHDVAKGLGRAELAAEITRDGIHIDFADSASPGILHGPIGAKWAAERYHVDDPEVLDAITYHTTGRRNPSPLLMVLMIADYIEPGRDFDGVDEARVAARELSLREAFAYITRDKLDDVTSRHGTAHPRALELLAQIDAEGWDSPRFAPARAEIAASPATGATA